jgi:hypothetical protein
MASLHKQRAGRRVPKAGADPAGRSYALTDHLYFRIRLSPSTPASAAQTVAERFTDAFLTVWRRVPEPGQERLLLYWRRETDLPASASPCPAPHALPLICIVDAGPQSAAGAFERLGHQLNFSASLVRERPDQLPRVIARTLAQVYLHSTRRYWAPVEELFEGPMERWEARNGKRATEAARLAKQEAVEQAFLRAYEREITTTLTGWGFGPGVAAEER